MPPLARAVNSVKVPFTTYGQRYSVVASAIAAERARVRSVDEGVPQARSGWRPTVTVQGQTGVRYIEQELTASGDQTNDTIYPASITGQVSQPLYRGGRTVANTARATADVLAARASLANVEQQVLLAEIGLQQAQDAMDDGTLKAPFAGVVGAVAITPGDLVSPSTVAIRSA